VRTKGACRFRSMKNIKLMPEISELSSGKVKNQKDIDAVLVQLLTGQCGVVCQGSREMGVNLPLFNFEIFEDASEVKLSEGAAYRAVVCKR